MKKVLILLMALMIGGVFNSLMAEEDEAYLNQFERQFPVNGKKRFFTCESASATDPRYFVTSDNYDREISALYEDVDGDVGSKVSDKIENINFFYKKVAGFYEKGSCQELKKKYPDEVIFVWDGIITPKVIDYFVEMRKKKDRRAYDEKIEQLAEKVFKSFQNQYPGFLVQTEGDIAKIKNWPKCGQQRDGTINLCVTTEISNTIESR